MPKINNKNLKYNSKKLFFSSLNILKRSVKYLTRSKCEFLSNISSSPPHPRTVKRDGCPSQYFTFLRCNVILSLQLCMHLINGTFRVVGAIFLRVQSVRALEGGVFSGGLRWDLA
jgi:hypothetical protein